VPRVGKGGVSGFAEELHCVGAKALQSLELDGKERIHRSGVVGAVVPTLVCAPESSSMARGASGSAKVRTGEGMDERDVAKHATGAWAQVATVVPAHLGAVGSVGAKPGVPPLAAGEEAQAANKYAQHFNCVLMAIYTRPHNRLHPRACGMPLPCT
jgi:hypothetical protein